MHHFIGPDLLFLFIGLFFFSIVIATFVLWIWAIIHCAKNPALDDTQRLVWMLIVIFLHALGAIIYFAAAPKSRT